MSATSAQLAKILNAPVSGAPSTAQASFRSLTKQSHGRKAAKALRFRTALDTYAGVLAALAVTGQVLPEVSTILGCAPAETLDSLTEALATQEFPYVGGRVIRLDPALVEKATGLGYLVLKSSNPDQQQHALMTMSSESLDFGSSDGWNETAAMMWCAGVWPTLASVSVSTWGTSVQREIRSLAALVSGSRGSP